MYRFEAENLVMSGNGPADVFKLPPILEPIRQEIMIRTVHMVGVDGLDSVFDRDIARSYIIDDALGRIAFDDFLDSLGVS